MGYLRKLIIYDKYTRLKTYQSLTDEVTITLTDIHDESKGLVIRLTAEEALELSKELKDLANQISQSNGAGLD